MKLLILLLVTTPFTFNTWNFGFEKSNQQNQKSVSEKLLANEIVGQWKRTAGGQDANKNRVLDDSEKMKLEPGAQDNLNLISNGKAKVSGMGMELDGTWLTKDYKGKRTLFIYTDDLKDLPQEDRDRSAMRFEIVSLQGDKLVVIPPIYEFMLSVYTRVK